VQRNLIYLPVGRASRASLLRAYWINFDRLENYHCLRTNISDDLFCAWHRHASLSLSPLLLLPLPACVVTPFYREKCCCIHISTLCKAWNTKSDCLLNLSLAFNEKLWKNTYRFSWSLLQPPASRERERGGNNRSIIRHFLRKERNTLSI
jgi:hypothetical protein